jgi:hypothetical protein
VLIVLAIIRITFTERVLELPISRIADAIPSDGLDRRR